MSETRIAGKNNNSIATYANAVVTWIHHLMIIIIHEMAILYLYSKHVSLQLAIF